jgi:hypothetical protein
MPPRRLMAIGRRQVLFDQVAHVGEGRKVHNEWIVNGRGKRRDQFSSGWARKHSYATMDSSPMATGIAARHDGKIGVAAENPSQGGAAQNLGVRTEAAYFNCDEIEEKVVLSFVPRPFTTLIIATEMPAAIRPYSMAVAAVSSFRKALSVRIMPRL